MELELKKIVESLKRLDELETHVQGLVKELDLPNSRWGRLQAWRERRAAVKKELYSDAIEFELNLRIIKLKLQSFAQLCKLLGIVGGLISGLWLLITAGSPVVFKLVGLWQ